MEIFERSIAPLRSVFRLNAFGCVIFGGADFRSRSYRCLYVDLGMGLALNTFFESADGSLTYRYMVACDKLNYLNFVDSCRDSDTLSKDCFRGSKSFLFSGRALNGPLFWISCRILSSVEMRSSCSLPRSTESRFWGMGTVTLDWQLCLPEGGRDSQPSTSLLS